MHVTSTKDHDVQNEDEQQLFNDGPVADPFGFTKDQHPDSNLMKDPFGFEEFQKHEETKGKLNYGNEMERLNKREKTTIADIVKDSERKDGSQFKSKKPNFTDWD